MNSIPAARAAASAVLSPRVVVADPFTDLVGEERHPFRPCPGQQGGGEGSVVVGGVPAVESHCTPSYGVPDTRAAAMNGSIDVAVVRLPPESCDRMNST
jgi:hypothetical protein